MGIRFYCPQCDQRIHVKETLAGKRAFCPHCDAGIEIPKESKSASKQKEVETVRTGDSTILNQQVELNDVETDEGVKVPESDPIREDPDLVWFVRPTNGGQYGPAPGETMRKWLQEGRVESDSFVWREGWEEWRVASEVFIELRPFEPTEQGDRTSRAAPKDELRIEKKAERKKSSATGSAKPTQLPKVSRAELAKTPIEVPPDTHAKIATRLNRRKGKGKEIAVIIVLGLICVVLAVVFGLVITKRI